VDDSNRYDDFHLIHPGHYAAHGYPHPIWTRLRREDPVHWWDRTEGLPFWAITKHADIVKVGRDPERFINGPRLVLDHLPEQPNFFPPTLIQIDPPQHTIYRKLINKRFTPGRLRPLHADIENIAKEIVDELGKESTEGRADFVEKVSAPLPIAVIAWLLGVPREDWNLLFDWTNRTIGATDPEFQVEGQDSRASALQAMTELFEYFTKLVAKKRAQPEDDLVSLFSRLEVDGKPIPEIDVLTFCLIIVVAGNETTRNATSGGMLAFIQHQDQLRKLQEQPELLAAAVEEVVRWTSPIIHFGRTATEDYELRGKRIKAGDALALFYPSANRDEEVFSDPFSFRIDRSPNNHLAFGVGEHYCLGAHVARLELEFAFKHLIPRIEEIEVDGPIDRLHSALVGGVKRLPIHYKLKRP
jgi:cytochrome P450